MTIPLVPYEGRMSYCLIKSIQMVLAHQGQTYPLPWLECVSGEPFGFAYIRDGQSFFAVDGYAYHEAGEHLLRTLNYAYTYTGAGARHLQASAAVGAADDATALAALEDALKTGPVVVGMLDMGYLTYNPGHRYALGSDHAIVVLALQPDAVIVHDPDGYPAVPLPLPDFLEAWKRDIYTGKPYGLWRIGAQGQPPTEAAIWETTLAHARELFTRSNEDLPDGRTILYGPNAMRALAADIQAAPDRDLGVLPHFSWRVSGQRCLDSAAFVREKLPTAADIRWEEAQIYGSLQQASAANERARLLELLEHLADLETRFIAALG